jgi:hypothetical protein
VAPSGSQRRDAKRIETYVEELRPIATRWGGARAPDANHPARGSSLRKLLERERRENPLADITLADVIESALQLSPSTWRSTAIQVFDLDHSKEPRATSSRWQDAAVGLGLKTDRSFRGQQLVAKWGGKNPLENTLYTTAEKLVRFEDGQRPALPELGSGSALDDIEVALVQAIRQRAWHEHVPPLLHQELTHVLLDAYDTLRLIQQETCFVSRTPALRLRMRIHDPEDEVYVLSRRDAELNVTKDDDWYEYVTWMNDKVTALREEARESRAGAGDLPGTGDPARIGINHKRLVVREVHDPPESAADELLDLHGLESLYTVTEGVLSHSHRYQLLPKLRYGFALSTRHGYALITVPHAPSDPNVRLTPGGIALFVERCANRGLRNGRMQAIVTADPRFVTELRQEFEHACEDPATRCLR